jgi:hypothetical protein
MMWNVAFRAIPSIVLIGIASLVACTTFNDLTADSSVPNPNGKNSGALCTTNSDCKSLDCKDGKCTAVAGANPTNTKKDGDETDVDCGGASAPPCEDGKGCKENEDCASSSCINGTCKAPSPDDGVKNADETDVDCGGANAPKCGSGKGCASDADCAVGGCTYDKKCIDFPSCVGHEGGDTCGPGETGEADAKHESCCTTIPDGNISIGKYYVTAGRMRAFVTKYNGDLQKWAATNPKGWNDSWTDSLPSSMDEALGALGPGNKRGCSVSQDGKGARTYWQPPLPDFRPDEKNDFPQKVLDEKILDCVPWVLAQAICHFDGGRMATAAELQNQITNHGTTQFPWGNSPAFPVTGQLEPQLAHFYSYNTPNPPADMRMSGGDPLDHSFFIPPPGRRPEGKNKIGVMDAVGSMLAWTGDRENTFAWTASWEEHGVMGTKVAGGGTYPSGPQDWPGNSSDANEVRDGYYGIGVRCAFDGK